MKKIFKRANSNSKKSKGIIRSEIRAYFPAKEYGVRSSLQAMKMDAESYNCGSLGRFSDYQKGSALVDAGCMACYHDDQRKMLRKIYGNQVDKWNGNRVHNTYKHLVGREYTSMLNARKRNK